MRTLTIATLVTLLAGAAAAQTVKKADDPISAEQKRLQQTEKQLREERQKAAEARARETSVLAELEVIERRPAGTSPASPLWTPASFKSIVVRQTVWRIAAAGKRAGRRTWRHFGRMPSVSRAKSIRTPPSVACYWRRSATSAPTTSGWWASSLRRRDDWRRSSATSRPSNDAWPRSRRRSRAPKLFRPRVSARCGAGCRGRRRVGW